MTKTKVTDQQIADARKAGFRRKPPKMPTGKNRTVGSVKKHIESYNKWAKGIQEAAKLGRNL